MDSLEGRKEHFVAPVPLPVWPSLGQVLGGRTGGIAPRLWSEEISLATPAGPDLTPALL